MGGLKLAKLVNNAQAGNNGQTGQYGKIGHRTALNTGIIDQIDQN